MHLLHSLHGKLIIASICVVLVAVAVAGAVFILVSRGDERDRELEHVASRSSTIESEFLLRQLRGDSQADLATFVRAAAQNHDVHILMLDQQQEVVTDSEGRLEGQQVRLDETTFTGEESASNVAYNTFQVDSGPPRNLVLVAPTRTIGGVNWTVDLSTSPIRYELVLAVSEDTLTRAWLNLLPALAIAAGIAIPVAVLLAVIIARYITRPLEQLTSASFSIASGRYDIEVPEQREDEVGRLARAFKLMSERVGEAQTRMRTLVANVSHDMKTPLTSIIGFSQVLHEEANLDPEETRRMAGIIQEEAKRLNSRLSDLLYLSEIESGQVVLQQDEIDLHTLLEATARRIQPEVSRRGITMTLHLAPLQTTTDGQKLERALENLLDNARKFTPDDGDIQIISRSNGNGIASIEVANTVTDIEPAELERLFHRFYRRDRSRGRDGHQAGSGLGLAIARDLVELLGGRLNASLQDGHIAFRMELPVDTA
ncbi:MAG: HAMP domain-containing histidine kinase [Chloroflexi bacterium]|nr:MAG: HAMP domain-containing histidine kinase [Chloroflexota bacterium]